MDSGSESDDVASTKLIHFHSDLTGHRLHCKHGHIGESILREDNSHHLQEKACRKKQGNRAPTLFVFSISQWLAVHSKNQPVDEGSNKCT